MTRKGNAKIGLIYSWSIPAVSTCPGKTAYCVKRCYAQKTQYRYPHPRLRWAKNFKIAQRPDFALLLSTALSRLEPNLIRIHVSGDFFSAKYLLDWIQALEENPHIKPFAFTRSWREASILKAIRLSGTPQWLLASTDPETGYGIPKGMVQADMVAGDYNYGTMKANYIHAIKALHTVVKNVCPQQLAKNPVTHISKVTCRSCGSCAGFKMKGDSFIQVPIKSVTFMEH